MKNLGIISGVGTLSGLNLYTKIINKFVLSGVNKDSDYPHITLNNYPFKSTSCFGVEDEFLIKKEIDEAMKPLINCDRLIISCNTLYCFLNNDTKFFNMPQLCLDQINPNDYSKTLVLCSKTSKDKKLFGNNVCYTNDNITSLTNNIINDLICGNFSNEKKYVNKLVNFINKSEYKNIILGCTELSLLNVAKLKKHITVIDSVDIVANAYFNYYKENSIESL